MRTLCCVASGPNGPGPGGERTKAGARARGRRGGRRPKVAARKRALAVDLHRREIHPIDEICRTMGVTKPTLYAYVEEADERQCGVANDRSERPAADEGDAEYCGEDFGIV